MIILTIIVFALAALLGVYLITYVLANKNTPKGVVMIHGGIAATGIVLLLIYSLMYESVWSSLFLFVMAALGGFTMFYLDLTGKKIPKILALGHGFIAICGFLLLVVFAFKVL